tara:strand:+ start:3723 stop:3887 length:165 start_codon:yes stop_codon:yes gene_type:complete
MIYEYTEEDNKPKCKLCDNQAGIRMYDTDNYCKYCYINFVLEPDEKNDYGKGKI